LRCPLTVPPAQPPTPTSSASSEASPGASSGALAERHLGRALLVGVLAVGAAFRIHWALNDDGLYWPDEVYQSLEPAHRLVYGYGLVAWEFVEGARNWVLPGLVAGVLGLARLLGVTAPGAYLGVIKGFFGLVGVATAWGSYRLARSQGASELAAAAGASLFALAAVPLYFAPRALSENASALPVVLGLALALPKASTRRAVLAGACLLGVAVLLRLQNGIFCVGLLGVLAAQRRWRAAGESLAVLAGWAFAYGLLDWLTWGRWFHSALVYLDFNILRNGAAGWGTAPFSYYGRVLFQGMPAVTLLMGALVLVAARRAPGLTAVAAVFFLLHALQPHKELRFLVPVLPLFAALAGVGLDTVLTGLGSRLASMAALGVVAVAAVSGLRAGRLTFGDVGQYEDSRPKASAWDDAGDVNRLLLAASGLRDVCGLKIEATHLAWTGGYSYFHQPVPLYPHNGPPRGSGLYSHVITPAQHASGEVVARSGPLVLARLREGCVPDPGYSWRLP
jgi:phosphatidylinositol glycan class B